MKLNNSTLVYQLCKKPPVITRWVLGSSGSASGGGGHFGFGVVVVGGLVVVGKTVMHVTLGGQGL